MKTKLQQLRKAAGVTQSQACFLAGIPSMSRLSEIENGKVHPGRARLAALAAVLHFDGDPEELLAAVTTEQPAGEAAR